MQMRSTVMITVAMSLLMSGTNGEGGDGLLPASVHQSSAQYLVSGEDDRVCWTGLGLRTYDPEREPPGKVHETDAAWLIVEGWSDGGNEAGRATITGDPTNGYPMVARWEREAAGRITITERVLLAPFVYTLTIEGDTLRGEAVVVHDVLDRETGQNRITRRPVDLLRADCGVRKRP